MITSSRDDDMIMLRFFIKAMNGLELLRTCYVNKDVRTDDLIFIIPSSTCEVWISFKNKFNAIGFPDRVTPDAVAKGIKKILQKDYGGCKKEEKGTQKRITDEVPQKCKTATMRDYPIQPVCQSSEVKISFDSVPFSDDKEKGLIRFLEEQMNTFMDSSGIGYDDLKISVQKILTAQLKHKGS